MDLIDRLREYASTRKGELAELIAEAADALERQTCEDAVSRADVIELVKDSYYNLAESIEDTWAMVADVEALPAVQPEPKPDKNGSEPFGNAEMIGDRTTDDCISRQAAIDALNDEITIIGKTNAVIVQDYIRRVNNRLHDLPAAQPEPKPDENGSEPFGNAEMLGDRTMDDCISRQAAIDIVNDLRDCISVDGYWAWTERLTRLPTVQPQQIVRCKDCKYWMRENISDGYCSEMNMGDCDEDFYCGYAERRTDE